MPRYDYCLFDLDGTLTDPGEGITRSVAYALSFFGIEVKDRTALYPFIGPPLVDSFSTFYGFSPEQARQAVGRYREYFSRQGIFENELYPGIKELLEDLKRHGVRILLASSKPELYARKILEHFQLLPFFDFVAAATMDDTRSKKTDVVRYALESCGISPDRAVMIGDRHHDIEGAKDNALESIGVLWGYGSREELSAAGATLLAESVPQLASLLGL